MKVWIAHVILQGPGSPLFAWSISYQWQVLCKVCQHPRWLHPPSVWWCVFVFPVRSGGANVQSLSHVQLLATHELQHTRLPCPSVFPRVCSSSCPVSWWSHPIISSSFLLSPPALISFPASQSFLTSQLFTSGGQSIGASASASVLPMNIQGWFPLGLTGLISLLSKGLSRVFSRIDLKASILQHSVFSMVQLSHPHVTPRKAKASGPQSNPEW